jgi:hypothetical protein
MMGGGYGANADDIKKYVLLLLILTPWIRDLDPIFGRPTDERFACVLHTFPYRDIYMTLRQKKRLWGLGKKWNTLLETHAEKPWSKK